MRHRRTPGGWILLILFMLLLVVVAVFTWTSYTVLDRTPDRVVLDPTLCSKQAFASGK